MARIDLTGQRFGRLTVIEYVGTVNQKAKWLCKCDCGNEKIVSTKCLRNGETKSCGCYHKDRASVANLTHGKTNSRLYITWNNIKNRCYRTSRKDYKNYGGRGITVCEEWRNSFQAFYEWAMANGYREDLTIDRINVNGNYEPSNCRWVDLKTQANNTRRNHYITYKGETHTIAEWSDITGISIAALVHRIERGWSVEEMLTVGDANRTMVTYNGETRSLTDWSKITGIKYSTIRGRARAGMSVEKILYKGKMHK